MMCRASQYALNKKTSGRRALNRAPSERAPDEGVDGIGDRIQKEGIQPVEHFAAQRLRNRIEGLGDAARDGGDGVAVSAD